MSKWYVEWKQHDNRFNRYHYMGGIEAKDGKEAIEYVRNNVAMGGYSFKAWHDDDEEV